MVGELVWWMAFCRLGLRLFFGLFDYLGLFGLTPNFFKLCGLDGGM